MNTSSSQKLLDARAEGYGASCYAECPYISGQHVLNDWHEGFVAKCVETGVIPTDTPPYLRGQIAYLQGVPCSELPDGEKTTGRWFSGWLVRRDNTPDQPNKRAGDTLLDAVFR